MNRRVLLAVFTAAVASGCLALAVLTAGAQDRPTDTTARAAETDRWFARAPEQLRWQRTDYGFMSVVYGDPRRGPYGAFNRFPAGTVIPRHTHSNAADVVVVSGVLYNYRPGDRRREYGPGSYLSEPPNIQHTTRCGTGAECLVYLTHREALDFKLVGRSRP